MRISIPATLLITLSAHHYLSHALPLSRPRSVVPRVVDYPVVNVADPDVDAPDSAPGDDEDDEDSDDIVTRTITRESEAPTGTHTSDEATSTEDCITSGIVPIVGVKATGAVRSTTTYTTRSSPKAPAKTPVVAPAPAPVPEPSPSAAQPTGAGSTSEASVSESVPTPSTSSVSSSDGPAYSRNSTTPIITFNPATTTQSEEPSSSTSDSIWSPPGVIIDAHDEYEPEPELTSSSAMWSAAPTPAPSGDGYVADNYSGDGYDQEDYDGDDYDEEDYDDEEYYGEEDYDDGSYDGEEYTGGEYVEDVYDTGEDAVSTTVFSIPPSLSTGNSEASYDSNGDGPPSWNGTTTYGSPHST